MWLSGLLAAGSRPGNRARSNLRWSFSSDSPVAQCESCVRSRGFIRQALDQDGSVALQDADRTSGIAVQHAEVIDVIADRGDVPSDAAVVDDRHSAGVVVDGA